MSKMQYILGPMRPPFLLLPPMCVLLGVGTAVQAVGHVNLWHVLLALIGAVCAHISVNAYNEYSDCKSGLDARTERTPFSGGSGVLPAHPEMAYVAFIIATVAIAITGAIGLYFTYLYGWQLLPLGILGILIIVAYTPLMQRQPLLCLIAPGLGFGTLMVMGTHFALTGHYSWPAFLASLVPFFLVNNLLLLNQFPDVEADRSVGRKHALIAWGRQRGSQIYALFLACTYLSIVGAVLFAYLPPWSLLGLATLFLAVPAARGAFRYAADIPHLTPYLGMNVVINLLTPLLVAVGCFVGK